MLCWENRVSPGEAPFTSDRSNASTVDRFYKLFWLRTPQSRSVLMRAVCRNWSSGTEHFSRRAARVSIPAPHLSRSGVTPDHQIFNPPVRYRSNGGV